MRLRVWDYKAQEEGSLRNAESLLGPQRPGSCPRSLLLPQGRGGTSQKLTREGGAPAHTGAWDPQARDGSAANKGPSTRGPCCVPWGGLEAEHNNVPTPTQGGQLSWALGDPRGRRPCNPRSREACHCPYTCKVGAWVWPTEPVSCLSLSVLMCLLISRIVIKEN